MTGAVQGLTGGATDAPAAQGTGPAGGIGKDEFLKLLVGQLRNQNPMNPLGDQEFIAQMAAFSTSPKVTPSVSLRKRNAETPRERAAGSVLAKTTYCSASPAFEIHAFCPFST